MVQSITSHCATTTGRRCSTQGIPKGQIIHAIGDNDDAALHFVVSGTIRVCNVSASGHALLVLAHLSNGEWFGEISS